MSVKDKRTTEETERIEYIKNLDRMERVKVIKSDDKFFSVGEEGFKSKNCRNRMLCVFRGRLIYVPYAWLTSEAYEIFKRLKNEK